MTAKSDAERKEKERKLKKAAGMVRFEAWIYPEHRERMKQYVDRLVRQR